MYQLILLLLWMTGCHISQPESLNVLIIYTDDQRYDTIGGLGNPEIKTPNLDALVKRGTTFTHAHTMGGLQAALCAPSRSMLMTGRPLFRLDALGDRIPIDHVMLPEILTDAGYITFATGKWHNDRASFVRAFQAGDHIFFGGMHMPEVGGHEAPELFEFDPTGAYPNDGRRQVNGYSSTLFADATIDFLSELRSTDQPFFAYVSFTSPHDPRTPPEPFRSWYHPDSVSLPPNFLPAHPFDIGHLDIRGEHLRSHPRTEEMVREELALYYGMVSELDAQIGRILDALEASGLSENTLIIVAGDNGLAVGSHGLLAKQNLYEHSMRVPLILAGPGIPSNEQRSQLVYIFDIFPTIAELLEIPLPQTVDGESIVQWIEDPQSSGRDAVFLAYRDLQRGIRTADGWKYIQYQVNGVHTQQLFDLNSDPFETQNLIADSSYSTKIKELRGILVQESRYWSDPLDLSAEYWTD